MTREEFVRLCSTSGYAAKTTAEKWCKEHPQVEYSEEDFVSVYYEDVGPQRGHHKVGWHEMGDGNRKTMNHIPGGIIGENRGWH